MKKFIPILLLSISIQGQVIKAKNEGGVLHVPVSVNGVLKIQMMIDTGAAECCLPPCIANTLMKTNTLIIPIHLLPNKIYSLADGSTQENRRFMIKSLKIGNETIYNVECSVSNNDNSPMLLGVSALKKLKNIRLNYKKNTVILKNK